MSSSERILEDFSFWLPLTWRLNPFNLMVKWLLSPHVQQYSISHEPPLAAPPVCEMRGVLDQQWPRPKRPNVGCYNQMIDRTIGRWVVVNDHVIIPNGAWFQYIPKPTNHQVAKDWAKYWAKYGTSWSNPSRRTPSRAPGGGGICSCGGVGPGHGGTQTAEQLRWTAEQRTRINRWIYALGLFGSTSNFAAKCLQI